jgi:hypothetical protein
VTFGQISGHGHASQSDDLKALALKPGEDLASQRSGEGVRLYEDQRAVH